MAPIAAETAPAQRQARRPLSRIVPAIPHRLSRTVPAARPITPEESNKGAITQNGPEPQPIAEKQADEPLPPTSAVDAPLTPDSRASGDEKSEVEATVLATSPAKSAEDHIERAPHHQDTKPSNDTKPTTNGHHRKLTVPAQLPPPFYPSVKVDTQTPPVDSNGTVPPSSHRSQLSAGAAAFSVLNASPATPVTPYDVEQERHTPQPTLTRPPPGFAPPEFTPSFFPGHAHHPSAAGAPWSYSSYPVPQPDAIYGNGPDYRQALFSADHVVHTAPYDGNLAPGDLNGATTSHSQSPSKSYFGEVKSSSEHGDAQRMLPYQNGMSSHERIEESPFELAAYLSTQFGNPEFADFILQIRSPESILVSIPVHGIVVVRSPVVAEAVRHSIPAAHRSRETRRVLDVLTSDPFVTRESLEEAVKVLYGAPLLSAQTFLYSVAPYAYDSDSSSPSGDARRRMQQLLSYIAAGRSLKLASMQARGVEIARSLLRWDTVDEVLQVTLQASSASHTKDGFEQDNPFTAALLGYAIEFIACTFPVDFTLHTIAPELQGLPRLPTVREPRPSTHNPRLSKIRFGDAPPGDRPQPSQASLVLSSVLLSLPLPLVDRLFNHRATANQIGWTGVVRVMRDVIVEREKRRQKALKGEVRPAADGAIPTILLNNLHLEERVEQVEESLLHPSGYRLVAQRLDGEL
ncbi:hypothetical protein CC86DRAFT_444928 [Ophiobolus disseminans]|uniref:Uncharacterized protein n=1 Tax=Ophiobolus disseminans TaxID=1469910 RepID=A0A6A7A6I1_9PLEO|nr:hypothetical protein CC86DRAFT_444928 [Ophiobolus disseminans]